MSKTKSITELVNDLQRENESLQNLKRLFNKACKDEFGYDVATIHEMVKHQEHHNKQNPKHNHSAN